MPMPTKEAQRLYQIEWLRKRRQSWIDAQGGCCAECGATDKLEVDHIDRKLKTMNPTSIWSRAESVRELELSNCQVLCESCHTNKTIREMDRSPHGTHNRYCTGCRCDSCRIAHNASTTEWKHKNK